MKRSVRFGVPFPPLHSAQPAGIDATLPLHSAMMPAGRRALSAVVCAVLLFVTVVVSAVRLALSAESAVPFEAAVAVTAAIAAITSVSTAATIRASTRD